MSKINESVPNAIKDVMKKSGVKLKNSTLMMLVGLGGKELDMIVKAVNALRPMIEERETTMKTYKELLEAVKIDTSRYECAHGKKPKKSSGGWMFTNVRMGDGDVFSAPFGSFADNVKLAKIWAKERNYSVIYIME
jgi:hypothetical protein